jgi:hypothetical protein
MIVVVAPTAVRLEEPDDVGRFHVAVEDGVVDVNAVLGDAGFGRIDDTTGEALIPVETVRQAARGRVGPDWEAGFIKMLSYAESRGWLAEDGAAIRAHIEVQPV